jgi:hypothetical protein
MNILPPGLESKRVHCLKTFCIGYGTALALFYVGLIACIVLWGVRRNEAHAEAISQQKLLKKASADLQALKRLPDKPAYDGLAAAGAFQEFLEDVASEHNCKVGDLHASPDMQLFLSRYAKTTDEKGWSQVPVSVTIQGATVNVFDTVAELEQCTVPMEIDSLTLTREALDGKGTATIGAQLQLRVLAMNKEKA